MYNSQVSKLCVCRGSQVLFYQFWGYMSRKRLGAAVGLFDLLEQESQTQNHARAALGGKKVSVWPANVSIQAEIGLKWIEASQKKTNFLTNLNFSNFESSWAIQIHLVGCVFETSVFESGV